MSAFDDAFDDAFDVANAETPTVTVRVAPVPVRNVRISSVFMPRFARVQRSK